MPVTIPYVRTPYDDRASTARIADLIRSRGAQRADAVARSGAIAGQMWADVGQTARGVITDLLRGRAMDAEQQQQRDAAARETSIQDAIRLTPRDPETGRLDPERIAQEVSHLDPERAMAWWAKADEQQVAQLAQERARGEAVAKAAGSLLIDLRQTPVPEQQPKWTAARTQALEAGLLTAPEQMPETVDMGWLKQTFDQARTVSDLSRELEAMRPKAPGTREVKVTNPDGSSTIKIVTDEPGQEFVSSPPPGAKPKAGTFEGLVDAMATEKGRPLSMAEVLAARRQWMDAGRQTPDGTPALSQAQRAAAERWKQAELRNAERVFREATQDIPTHREDPEDDLTWQVALAELEDAKERIQLSFLEQIGSTDTTLPDRGDSAPRRATAPPPGAPGAVAGPGGPTHRPDTPPPPARERTWGDTVGDVKDLIAPVFRGHRVGDLVVTGDGRRFRVEAIRPDRTREVRQVAPTPGGRFLMQNGIPVPLDERGPASPPSPSSASITIKLPNGTFATFPSQAAADAFLKEAGLTIRR